MKIYEAIVRERGRKEAITALEKKILPREIW